MLKKPVGHLKHNIVVTTDETGCVQQKRL